MENKQSFTNPQLSSGTVRIITDSAADLEPEEYKRLNITCIPLTVSFGDSEYKENVNMSKKKFYNLLETQEQFPKTAQPSPYELESILKKAKACGDEAVVITLSSALSGIYQGVVLTKERLNYDKCCVVDSLTATGGQRILAEHAAMLRDMGKKAHEIAEELIALRSKIMLYACIDTLEYLHRGGRISHTAATIGTAVKIKPIIHVTKSGNVDVIGKVLSRVQGMRRLLKYTEDKKSDSRFPIYVMYSHDRKNAETLTNHLKTSKIIVPNNHIINVGAAIGSHIGPNAFGLVYVAAE